MGKHDNSRRTKGKFIALPHTLITSPAFRSLNGGTLKVYIELYDRYMGTNNGDLHLSCGEAAKLLHISKSTVSRAFRELNEKGFLRCTSQGNWIERRASTWLLTHKGGNGRSTPLTPTNEWKNWNANGKAFQGADMAPIGGSNETKRVPV